MKKFTNHKERWGSFVDVKVNAPGLLERQLRNINSNGEVMMSSVCDGWQKQEEFFKLSRQCLEILLTQSKFSVTILTKSALITRDLDIIGRFKERVELGVTLTATDPAIQKLIEPYSSTTAERFKILKEAKNRFIKTYVFIGPLIPGFSDTKENLEYIFKYISSLNLSKVYVDKLNYYNQFYRDIKEGLRPGYPQIFDAYFEPLRDPAKMDSYVKELKSRVAEIIKKYNLEDKTEVLFC